MRGWEKKVEVFIGLKIGCTGSQTNLIVFGRKHVHGRSHEGKVFEKLFIIVNINKNYKCNCR